MYPRYSLLAIWTLSFVAFAGCAKSDKLDKKSAGFVPVTGTVTLDDQPVADATVTFLAGHADAVGAAGITDKDGRYSLFAGKDKHPGAYPGKYRVIISRIEREGKVVTETPDKSWEILKQEGAKETIPAGYSDFLGGQLEEFIPEGGGKIDFRLSSSFK